MMTEGKRGGAYVGVPVASARASWVPATPVPRSLQLANLDDGGGGDSEDTTISWSSSSTPGNQLMVTVFFIIWSIVFCGILNEQPGVAAFFFVCLAALVFGGFLLHFRDTMWPPHYTLTVAPEAVRHSRHSHSPECMLAVARCLGGNGYRTMTETFPRGCVVDLSAAATLGQYNHKKMKYVIEVVLNSSNGRIIELTLPDKKAQHWLHVLLLNWRNNGSGGGGRGGVPLVLASLNGPAVLASAPPATATVVLV